VTVDAVGQLVSIGRTLSHRLVLISGECWPRQAPRHGATGLPRFRPALVVTGFEAVDDLRHIREKLIAGPQIFDEP
jgi:hypothetical protein